MCQDCPKANAGSFVVACIVGVLILLALGGLRFAINRRATFCTALRRWIYAARMLWISVGVVPKLKLFLAFSQVVATLDRTYSVGLPETWTKWTAVFRVLGDLDWTGWVVPSACIVGSGFKERLSLRAIAPLAVVVAMPVVGAAISALRHCASRHIGTAATSSDAPATAGRNLSKHLVHAMKIGILEWLPASLILAFCFTPSVSASIFRAWHCEAYAYDDFELRSFLAQDLSVRCDGSNEHKQILAVAWVYAAVWPVGMVAMYAALLVPCGLLLLNDDSDSRLVRATAFLHRDYKPNYFWWEYCALGFELLLAARVAD